MPTYEFACDHCETRIEFTQSIKTDLPKACKVCGKTYPDFHQVYGNITFIARSGQNAFECSIKRQPLNPEPVDTEPPWFRSGEVPGLPRMDKPLDISKIKDTQRYIETGDTQ